MTPDTERDRRAESAAPQDMIQHCLDMADRCKQEARILMEQAEDLILRAGAWQQRAVQRQEREAALIDGSGGGSDG